MDEEELQEESKENERPPVIVFFKVSSHDKCNWLSTTIGGAIGIVGPYGLFVAPAVAIVAPVTILYGAKS